METLFFYLKIWWVIAVILLMLTCVICIVTLPSFSKENNLDTWYAGFKAAGAIALFWPVFIVIAFVKLLFVAFELVKTVKWKKNTHAQSADTQN